LPDQFFHISPTGQVFNNYHISFITEIIGNEQEKFFLNESFILY